MEEFVGLFRNSPVYEGFKPGETYIVRFSSDYSIEQIQESYNIISNAFKESKFLFIPVDIEFEKASIETLAEWKRKVEEAIYELKRKEFNAIHS